MIRYAAVGLAASLLLLAWRLLAEARQLREGEDRATAYRRWADWAEQDAAFRQRWGV